MIGACCDCALVHHVDTPGEVASTGFQVHLPHPTPNLQAGLKIGTKLIEMWSQTCPAATSLLFSQQ